MAIVLAPYSLDFNPIKWRTFFAVDGYVSKITWKCPRCLVPAFDGAIFSLEWKEALWDKFHTAAPRRLRPFVEQSKIVKKA